MNDPKNFSQLNLIELERLASTWVEEYPIIEKITLYSGKILPHSGKEPKTHYVFIVRICKRPHRKDVEYQNYKYFLEWTSESCLHIQSELERAYKEASVGYHLEWAWFNLEPDDELPTEFISLKYPWILYERDDQPCSVASAVVASPATPSSAEGRISENSRDSSYKQIKGEEIINLLSIAPFELIEYMEYGLPAYTPSGKKVYIRSDLNRGPSQKVKDKASRRHTVHKMSKVRGRGGIGSDISPDPPGLHGIDLLLPENEKKAREIIKEILGFYFLIDDYEEFAKIHGLEPLIDRTDPEISKKSVRSKSEPAANKPEPISAEKDADQENFASALGKKGAHRRWGHYNELMDKALKLADNKWANGDDSWHSEMAEHLVSKSGYRELEPYRKALQKRLIPIADNYGRVRGKKGATKEKK